MDRYLEHNPITISTLTPTAYKEMAWEGVIYYDTTATPFGEVLIATTALGICALQFTEGEVARAVAELQHHWAGATLLHSQRHMAEILSLLSGRGDRPPQLLLKGTPFQTTVWSALHAIPVGEVVSYAQLAEGIGNRKAVRAVASAIAQNPIALILPCHRVIKSSGAIGEYHWGSDRKRAILSWEGWSDPNTPESR